MTTGAARRARWQRLVFSAALAALGTACAFAAVAASVYTGAANERAAQQAALLVYALFGAAAGAVCAWLHAALDGMPSSAQRALAVAMVRRSALSPAIATPASMTRVAARATPTQVASDWAATRPDLRAPAVPATAARPVSPCDPAVPALTRASAEHAGALSAH